METTRLDLDALRSGKLPEPARAIDVLEQLLRNGRGLRIGRRTFLIGGSVGVASATAALGALERASNAFSVGGDCKRLAFVLGGKETWVIDPAMFDGHPRLECEQQRGGAMEVRLSQARFPGTQLPADFVARIRRTAAGWKVRLQMALAGFDAQGSFVRWLAGRADLRSCARLRELACPLGRAGWVELRGGASVAFFPDWTVRFSGKRVGRVEGSAAAISDAVSLSLLSKQAPSAIRKPLVRRSLMVLDRGTHAWAFPEVARRGSWRIASTSEAFDRVRIEVGTAASGETAGALIASRTSGEGGMHFVPSSTLQDRDGADSTLALRDQRWAYAFDDQLREQALVASFAEQAGSLHGPGFGVDLTGAGAAPLEIVQDPAGKTQMTARPNVRCVLVSLAGASGSVMEFASPRPLSFAWNEGAGAGGDTGACLRIGSDGPCLCVDLDGNVWTTVTRHIDLLRLRFAFEGMKLSAGPSGEPQLEPAHPFDDQRPRRMYVEFPPQHIAERAFHRQQDDPDKQADQSPPDVSAPNEPYVNPAVESRSAGVSRLVFRLPWRNIPFTAEGLLQWSGYPMELDPRACPPGEPVSDPAMVNPCGRTVTYIEFPYRMVLSPTKLSGWITETNGPRDTGYTELWRARLGSIAGTRPDRDLKDVEWPSGVRLVRGEKQLLRALWSPDMKGPLDVVVARDQPFLNSLDEKDRHEIVHLSANFAMRSQDKPAPAPFYAPNPLDAERVALSSLGAWVKLRGHWDKFKIDNNQSFEVEEWRHAASMGRDSEVQVVRRGYLCPLGHRAALIKVTRREFATAPDGSRVAYLNQYSYVAIRRPEKAYPAFGQKSAGRKAPFRNVRMLTTITPELAKPDLQDGCFWPKVGSADFPFQLWAEDHEGFEWAGSMPLLFVLASTAENHPEKAIAQYKNGTPDQRTCRINGEKIAYAPSSKPRDTALTTHTLTFLADEAVGMTDPLDLFRQDQPGFYPRLETASVDLEGVGHLTSNPATATVAYDTGYLDNGFDPALNRGEVFLQIRDEQYLQFGAGQANGDRAGGLVTPSARLIGISRRLGPVGGSVRPSQPGSATDGTTVNVTTLAKINAGQFDPLDFFGNALRGARILGAVNLWDVVRPIAAAALDNLDEAPRLLTDLQHALAAGVVAAQARVHDVFAALDRNAPALAARFRDTVVRMDATAQKLKDVPDGSTGNEDQQRDIVSYAADVQTLASEVASVVRNPSQLLPDALQNLFSLSDDFFADFTDKAANALIDAASGVLTPAAGVIAEIRPVLEKAYDLGKNLADEVQTHQAAIAAEIDQAKKVVHSGGNLVAAIVQRQLEAVDDLASFGRAASTLLDVKDPSRQFAAMRDDLLSVVVLGKTPAEWQSAIDGQRQAIERQFGAVQSLYGAALKQRQATSAAFSEARRRVDASLDLMQACFTGSQPADAVGKILDTAERIASAQEKLLADLQQLRNALDALKGLPIDSGGSLLTAPDDLRKALVETGTTLSIAARATQVYSLTQSYAAMLPDAVSADVATAARAVRDNTGTIGNDAQSLQRLIEIAHQWRTARGPFQRAVLVLSLDAAGKAAFDRARQKRDQLSQAVVEYGKKFKPFRDHLEALREKLPPLIKNAFADVSAPLFKKLDEAASGLDTADSLRQLLVEMQNLWSAVTSQIGSLPKLLVQAMLKEAQALLQDVVGSLLIPDSVKVHYQWKPKLKDFPSGAPIFRAKSSNKDHPTDATLTIRVELETALRSHGATKKGDTSFSIVGTLTSFGIDLLGNPSFIIVNFKQLTFTASSKEKPSVHPDLEGVHLGKALSFVEPLQALLSPSTGAFIELSTNGIRAGYAFGISQVIVGALVLSNLRFSIAFDLPFDGKPLRCRFGISDAAHPFLITWTIFGGGGFLSLAVGLDGVEEISGALEFGVHAAINIGIASGEGFVLAGIYFSFGGGNATLSGFVHAGGYLDILGLISMSLYLAVELTWENGRVYGTASVTVQIEILFFSAEVKVEASYTFSGGHENVGLSASLSAARPELPAVGDLTDLTLPENFAAYFAAFAD